MEKSPKSEEAAMKDKEVLVIYKSKYGATERYAKWIAEELGCEAIPAKEAKLKRIRDYDMLIFGGGLYAGTIGGISKLTGRFEDLKKKHLMVFTCGLTEPGDNGYYTYLITRNFTEVMRKRIHFFFFPGAIDKDKLSWLDKKLMTAVMKSQAKKDPEHAEDYLAMKHDLVDRKYIGSLVEKAQGILQEDRDKRAYQQQLRQEALQRAQEEEEAAQKAFEEKKARFAAMDQAEFEARKARILAKEAEKEKKE